MATASTDLIDFNLIEDQKENIQSLPSGRSAKALASLYSPRALSTPLSTTQDLNESARATFEAEIAGAADSDDPLDIFDRYIRWTLDAYPSAQATSASGLLPLLERATNAFLDSEHYKNDPRYLRIWLQYIKNFSDSPRESFAFLARHGVGSGLAAWYEEFAAWLEAAGRWSQAEEVYALGLERAARPAERLGRKFEQFRVRRAAALENDAALEEPRSPALPVRVALSVREGAGVEEVQGQSQGERKVGTNKKKLQIFADEGHAEQPACAGPEDAKGWERIGGRQERKKENSVAATAWAGETMKMGARVNVGVPKMAIFKDQTSSSITRQRQTLNEQALPPPATNIRALPPPKKSTRLERVVVDLEAIYPNPDDPTEEYCLEEIYAASQGWLARDWRAAAGTEDRSVIQEIKRQETGPEEEQEMHGENPDATTFIVPLKADEDEPPQMTSQLVLNDENIPSGRGGVGAPADEAAIARRVRREEKANKTRKIRVRKEKSETQTVQTNFNSPQGPKIKRKKGGEATMTMHSKAAMNDLYDMFNQTLPSLKKTELEDEQEGAGSSESESDESDDEYTSGAESTRTGNFSVAASEVGDDTRAELTETRSVGEETPNVTEDAATTTVDVTEEAHGEVEREQGAENATGWTEFTRSNDMTEPDAAETRDDSGVDFTSTKAAEEVVDELAHLQLETREHQAQFEEVTTPTWPVDSQAESYEIQFIPVPPEGHEAPTRPYRDAAQAAQSRLPFMTPIVEKTESSLGALTQRRERDYFVAKTPCPKADQKSLLIAEVEHDTWVSPLKDALIEVPEEEDLLKSWSEPAKVATVEAIRPAAKVVAVKKDKGPIIKDAQCNPMDVEVRATILKEMHPALSTYDGYFEHTEHDSGRKTEIRKYCKIIKNNKSSSEKSNSTFTAPPVLDFAGSERVYSVKRQLGEGGYASIYLAEQKEKSTQQEQEQAVMGKGVFGIQRRALEAIKMEHPPSAWEFHMLRLAHRRLGVSRPVESIVRAYEMHLFKDEGFLVEEFRDQGSLLDLVNAFHEQGGPMEETLAMFFTVEVLRTVEALHEKDIIHGDLKADNVLLRLTDSEVGSAYTRNGASGWAGKGVMLIDFGRAIDMRNFKTGVQFIADWQTDATDCAEMRELRPWTYQCDYHGMAAIAHALLFGKYIETSVEKGASAGVGAGAAGKTYVVKESLKRYWQTEMWGELFNVLLNPARHVLEEEGGKLPCSQTLRRCREKMESYLEEQGERGSGLRTLIRKVEAGVKKKW